MQRTLCLHISLNYLAMECFVFATSLGEQSMLCADGFPTCQSLPSLQWVWLMLWTISSLSPLGSAVQKGCVWAFPLVDVVQCRKPFSKLPLLQAPSPFPLNLKFLRTQPNGSREASVYTSSGTNGLHDCVQEDRTQLFILFNFHVVVVKFRFHQWICSAQLILSLTLRQKLWETRPLADVHRRVKSLHKEKKKNYLSLLVNSNVAIKQWTL